MRTLHSPRLTRRAADRWRREGRSIGFVCTMGALHEAHQSLIRRCRAENDRAIVSIFLNPKQFGPKEDLNRYPRPFKRDARICNEERVDLLYHPGPQDMYPEGFRTETEVTGLSDLYCGTGRPGHFRGVTTVVLKLLMATAPDRIYFGEKDFQQLVLIKRMARDLDIPVKVIGCPTVRESDGLALSSRNIYLSPAQRRHAPRFFAALKNGAALARKRGSTVARVESAILRELRKIPGARPEYAHVVDSRTLLRPRHLTGRLRILAALHFGRTRLIDNIGVFVK